MGRKLLVLVAAAVVAAVLLAVPSALVWRLSAVGDDGEGTGPASGPAATGVSAGTTHSCAVTRAGSLLCWGANGDLQLGTGLRTWSSVPVPVVRLDSGVAEVAAGGSHTCARTVDGAVSCWSRQGVTLGIGDTGASTAAPVRLPRPAGGVASISAGNAHTCARTDAGTVLCWGEFHGPDLVPRAFVRPTPVRGLGAGVRWVSAEFDDACAVTAAGAVRCWGEHYPAGAGTSPLTPVTVAGPRSGAVAVTVGGTHACALTDAGGVRCWGANRLGQLGNGTTEDSPTPVPVAGLDPDAVAVSAGHQFACALTGAGAVHCWGHNEYGQLGDGTTRDSPTPVPVAGLGSGVVAIDAGFQHACALTRDAAVTCWGYNFEGQLGIGAGTTSFSAVPTDVVAPARQP